MSTIWSVVSRHSLRLHIVFLIWIFNDFNEHSFKHCLGSLAGIIFDPVLFFGCLSHQGRNQEPRGTKTQEPRTTSSKQNQAPRTKNHEFKAKPSTKNQEPRGQTGTKNQEPGVPPRQEPRTGNQKPRTRNQGPPGTLLTGVPTALETATSTCSARSDPKFTPGATPRWAFVAIAVSRIPCFDEDYPISVGMDARHSKHEALFAQCKELLARRRWPLLLQLPWWGVRSLQGAAESWHCLPNLSLKAMENRWTQRLEHPMSWRKTLDPWKELISEFPFLLMSPSGNSRSDCSTPGVLPFIRDN